MRENSLSGGVMQQRRSETSSESPERILDPEHRYEVLPRRASLFLTPLSPPLPFFLLPFPPSLSFLILKGNFPYPLPPPL